MDTHSIFGAVAAGLSVFACAYYIYTILRGRTRPSRSSYWIWSGLGTLILLTYISSGGTNWWLMAVNTVGTGAIAVLTIRYGEGERMNKWDRRSIGLALSSLPLWFGLSCFMPASVAALPVFIVQMFADAVGCVPTFEKAWNRPENEDRSAWAVAFASYVVNTGAVRQWTLQDAIWNGWLGFGCLAVLLMLFFRPRSTIIT